MIFPKFEPVLHVIHDLDTVIIHYTEILQEYTDKAISQNFIERNYS